MAPIWKVVGGELSGGIVVRAGVAQMQFKSFKSLLGGIPWRQVTNMFAVGNSGNRSTRFQGIERIQCDLFEVELASEKLQERLATGMCQKPPQPSFSNNII